MEAAAKTISSTGSAGSILLGIVPVWDPVSGAVASLLAAGSQREREGEREEQRYEPFFMGFFFLSK